MKTRRLVMLGLFIAIAGILHVVESWLPLPLPIPGVKLGLANITSLAIISLYGWQDALVVAGLRVILGTLLGGALLGPAFFMGLSGAFASTVVMAYAYRCLRPTLSLVGISVLGAAVHNVAQICVAAVIVSSIGILWYLPYLLLFALPTGLATGMTTSFLLAKLPPDYN